MNSQSEKLSGYLGRRTHSKINYRSLAGMKANSPYLKDDSLANGKKGKFSKRTLGKGDDLLEKCLSKSGIKCLGKKKSRKKSHNEMLDGERMESQAREACRSPQLCEDSDTPKEMNPVHAGDLHSKRISELKMDSYLSESDGEMSGIHERRKIFICRSVEDIDKFTLRRPFDSKHTCEICGKKYTTKSILNSHKVRHLKKSEQPFACSLCDFRAASNFDLVRHSTKHKKQHFNCPFCSKVFRRETSVNEHVKSSHVMNFTLECSKCGFRTCKKSNMRNHILNHDGPTFSCPVCGAFFNYKKNLQVHLRGHTGVRAHECSECGKKFFKSNDLTAHVQKVHKPKTYECNVCKKKFSTVHHLKRHFLTHTDEKPFGCCFCTFASNTHGNLLKHIRSSHGKLNFTYKDVLKAKGELKNPKDVLPLHRLQALNEMGYQVAEQELQKLQRMGLPRMDVKDLQKNVEAKRQAKVASVKSKKLRKSRTKAKDDSHKKNFMNQCAMKADYPHPHPEILCSISPNFCVPLEQPQKREGAEGALNPLDSDFLDSAIDYDACDSGGQEGGYGNRLLPQLEVEPPEIGGEFIIGELGGDVPGDGAMTLVSEQDAFPKPCNSVIVIDGGRTRGEMDSMHFYKVVKDPQLPIFPHLENPRGDVAPETHSPLVVGHPSDSVFVIRTITGHLPPAKGARLDASSEAAFEEMPNEVMISVNERDFAP